MSITRRTVLGLGACLALSTAVQAADTVNWDMPNEYGATSIPAEADRLFAERVKDEERRHDRHHQPLRRLAGLQVP